MASTSHPSSAPLSLSCAALLWLAGCSSVQLVPLQPTRGHQALVVGSGIEVSADARQHPPNVPSNFTPVRLSVHNTGNAPLYVNLEDIELERADPENMDRAGPERALDAVPPGSVPATPRIASLGMDPMSPFLVQQTTGGSGPRAGRTESVILEPRPGSLPDWASGRDGSRREIARSAFRGGAIGAGETRAGFVYFRFVPQLSSGDPAAPRGAERVTLRVGVRSSPHGAEAAVVEIPYAVRS
jgi:hypothetical protein